jgi:hypothetical protein
MCTVVENQHPTLAFASAEVAKQLLRAGHRCLKNAYISSQRKLKDRK